MQAAIIMELQQINDAFKNTIKDLQEAMKETHTRNKAIAKDTADLYKAKFSRLENQVVEARKNANED